MITAAINDNSYNIVLLLHLISIILGTGAVFVTPVLIAKERQKLISPAICEQVMGQLISPSLLLGGVFGGALVGMSNDVYDFGQTWLAIGGALWMIAVLCAVLVFPPTFVNLPDFTIKKSILSGILHLALAGMLVLMVWKPGY